MRLQPRFPDAVPDAAEAAYTSHFMETLRNSLGIGLVAAIVWAAPSVFPTGTTIYDPGKAWNGYTVLSPLGTQAALIIDMNGNVVKRWDGFNSSAGGPVRILPGGIVVGAAGANPPNQESRELVEKDFDGNVLWSFNHTEQIEISSGRGASPATEKFEKIWTARQHHDWQRDDFPAGYYSPGIAPARDGVKTLLLTHANYVQSRVAPKAALNDDRLLEISWDGKILWEWVASDHIEDFHFSQDARDAIASVSTQDSARDFDWLHLNAAAYVGPNHWYDEGDKRFAPENVIISSREASFVAIVARDGSIVWQMGPDFNASPELRAIRQIIGQHNAHFIPKGLPGAGNLMVFDNGGASGYGRPTPVAPNGSAIFARPTSRVLEIDPVALKLVWSYNAPAFFATNISGAQRLPNGNTLVTEGPDGRIFEVTREGTIVWEYVFPLFAGAGARPTNSVYRAYRLPYDWHPQLARPVEKRLPRLASSGCHKT
jgi:Arylsulfotransferase (ASST)